MYFDIVKLKIRIRIFLKLCYFWTNINVIKYKWYKELYASFDVKVYPHNGNFRKRFCKKIFLSFIETIKDGTMAKMWANFLPDSLLFHHWYCYCLIYIMDVNGLLFSLAFIAVVMQMVITNICVINRTVEVLWKECTV